jgi:hypothetical protein
MKTLKLQVGKTYRNRKGEEVKIVKRDNQYIKPYQGSNGKWYTESGKWGIISGEHPKDLIEEVEEVSSEPTRHTFDIPDGVKKVTVEQVGNRIVVEMVPEEVELKPGKEPKPGDVMINIHGNVYIFKESDGDKHNFYAWLGESGRLSISGICEPGRPATPEEAQPLFDALKKAGKRWNPETMQVEEITESDRIREWVERYVLEGCYSEEGIADVIEAYLKYREGEK